MKFYIFIIKRWWKILVTAIVKVIVIFINSHSGVADGYWSKYDAKVKSIV